MVIFLPKVILTTVLTITAHYSVGISLVKIILTYLLV